MSADIRESMKMRLYRREPVFSFEFFPPKDEEGERTLARSLDDLAPLGPTFISVTCGAGGSTRERTGALVGDLQRRYPFGVMAHVVACGSSAGQLAALVRDYAAAGVGSFLALRGDPPAGAPGTGPGAAPVPGQPAHADEVVRIVRANAPRASVGVAGYPETHPQAASADEDLVHLARKVAAGADFVVTQLFFDNEAYFDFVRRARRAGVRVPILPGIMPVTRAAQIERFRSLGGGRMAFPPAFLRGLAAAGDDAARAREFGVAYCAAQCADLLRRGAPGIHLYTLNQSRTCHAVYEVLRALGWSDAPGTGGGADGA